MSGRRLLQQALGLMLAVLLLAGCSGTPAGQEGEIVGIRAQVSLEEAQSGKIKNMAYLGTIVVLLADGEKVAANCADEFLSDIKGAPTFNAERIKGGLVATITVNLKEHQKALLVRNDAGEWEIAKVLE